MGTKLKVILIILGVVVAGVGGSEIYAKYSQNDDWAIVENLYDYLTGVKNEQAGCCLPQCGEAGKTICEQSAGKWTNKKCSQISACEKGCCPPQEGLVTHEECKQLNGNDNAWKKQEQCKGNWVNLEGSSHTNIAEGLYGDLKYTFKLHACDQAKKDWSGTWSVIWTFTSSGGPNTEQKNNEGIEFTLSDAGEATYNLLELYQGTATADFKMSGNTMSVNVKHGSVINPIQTSGEIFKGAALCETSDNKNQ